MQNGRSKEAIGCPHPQPNPAACCAQRRALGTKRSPGGLIAVSHTPAGPANGQERTATRAGGRLTELAAMAGALTRYMSQALGTPAFRDAWKAGGWKVLIDGNLA